MKRATRVIDWLAWRSGVLRLQRSRLRGALTILMYHRVLPASEAGAYPLASLVVTSECFQGQVEWLAENARIVTVEEGLARLEAGGRQDRPMVALTFDDGYDDNAMHAAPIIESVGGRGTFYVTTSFVRGGTLWFDAAAHAWQAARAGEAAWPEGVGEGDPRRGTLDAWLGWLKSLGTDECERVAGAMDLGTRGVAWRAMTAEQVGALAGRGHEIGSHTVDHPILTRSEPARVKRELDESMDLVRAWTGRARVGFCYPNGSFDEVVRRACVDAGYTYAVSTLAHANRRGVDRWVLGRRGITGTHTTVGGRHAPASFAAEVVGMHDLIRRTTARARGTTPSGDGVGNGGGSAVARDRRWAA